MTPTKTLKIMNIKFIVIYSLLIISSPRLFAQNFSGKITYKFSYLTKDKNIHKTDLEIEMPTDSVVYTIMNGHYKSERYYEGKLIEYYTYNNQSKKMFYTTQDRNYYIYFLPHDQKYKTSLYTEHHTGKDSVLNFSTYKLTSIINGQENMNFYHHSIAVEPTSFDGHLFGAWDQLLKKNEGAIPLKTITNNFDHYEIKSAIRVEYVVLRPSDFEPEKEKLIVASRESLEIPAATENPSQETYYCFKAKAEKIASRMIEGKNYNYILRMIIDENGQASHIKAINSNYLGFEKIAEQIIKDCDFTFVPGQIGNQYQKAEIFMPLRF